MSIQVKYKELFSLSIAQDFYQNGVCRKYTNTPSPDLALIPTEECELLMRRMDIVYRNNDQEAGGIVLARVSGITGGGNDVLRFKATASDKLSFYSILRNSDVLSFNDLPVSADPDRLFYFSNSVTDPLAPRNDLHLTKTAIGVDGITDAVRKTGPNYRYHHASPVAAGTAFVKHLLSGTQTEAKSIINQGGQADVFFDLSTLLSGKCELIIGGLVRDSFYFLKNGFSMQVFGVVEVMLSQLLDSNYRVVEIDQSLTPDRPVYKIKFLKRKTAWRYTLHLSANSSLTRKMAAMTAPEKAAYLANLKIETNDTTITFSQVSASDTDIVFVSATSIALQEKYISSTSGTGEPLIITLKENTGLVNEAVVKTNLPYPSPSSINARNLPIIYSDILITL